MGQCFFFAPKSNTKQHKSAPKKQRLQHRLNDNFATFLK